MSDPSDADKDMFCATGTGKLPDAASILNNLINKNALHVEQTGLTGNDAN